MGSVDLYPALWVGFFTYFMLLMKYLIAPKVIGVILARLFDETLRRALVLLDGNHWVFASRPGAAVMLALIVSQPPVAKHVFAREKGGTVGCMLSSSISL